MKLNYSKLITAFLVSALFTIGLMVMFQLAPAISGFLGGMIAGLLCPNPIEEKK